MADAVFDALQAVYDSGIGALEKCEELRQLSANQLVFHGLLPCPTRVQVNANFQTISDALDVYREHQTVAWRAIYRMYGGKRDKPFKYCDVRNSSVTRIAWDVIHRVGGFALQALREETDGDVCRVLAQEFSPEITEDGLKDLKAAYKQEIENAVVTMSERTDGPDGDGKTKTKKKVKRGGRKQETDPKQDRRIAEAWQTGRYARYEDLAKEEKTTKREVKLAIDRHRHR